MSRFLCYSVLFACFTTFGCSEAKTKFDPNYKASAEENQKINAEDKMIDDEESQGTASKTKPKAKAKR